MYGTNEALLHVLEKAMEAINKAHANLQDGVCLPEEPCAYCHIQQTLLDASSEVWERDTATLDERLEMWIMQCLPNVPSEDRKEALHRCQKKVEEFLNGLED
jgi:hypothetical protein